MTSHLKPQKCAGIQPGTASVPLSRMIPPPYEVRASNMPFDPPSAFPRLRLGQALAGQSRR
jgi:hypothetical protein